ncbi:unnamed protein product [Ectocarpus sp. CCAP 1310/34]|nr:unnamed protein product [Ectocarpus sp. CCAP 1310/34]
MRLRAKNQRVVEYAIEAIKLGSTAVGIQTKEGVVLAVEKRLTSPLLEPSSVEKASDEVLVGIDLSCWF